MACAFPTLIGRFFRNLVTGLPSFTYLTQIDKCLWAVRSVLSSNIIAYTPDSTIPETNTLSNMVLMNDWISEMVSQLRFLFFKLAPFNA